MHDCQLSNFTDIGICISPGVHINADKVALANIGCTAVWLYGGDHAVASVFTNCEFTDVGTNRGRRCRVAALWVDALTDVVVQDCTFAGCSDFAVVADVPTSLLDAVAKVMEKFQMPNPGNIRALRESPRARTLQGCTFEGDRCGVSPPARWGKAHTVANADCPVAVIAQGQCKVVLKGCTLSNCCVVKVHRSTEGSTADAAPHVEISSPEAHVITIPKMPERK
jgi:hypothetical protein